MAKNGPKWKIVTSVIHHISKFLGGKRAKSDLKLLISVCFALYLRNSRLYHQDFDNDIYKYFSLYFFKKCNIVNIKIVLFLLAHFNSFFNNSLFLSSSINAKKKFWGVPHLLHMCVIFFSVILVSSTDLWHFLRGQINFDHHYHSFGNPERYSEIYISNASNMSILNRKLKGGRKTERGKITN